jgi:hypothetical protein
MRCKNMPIYSKYMFDMGIIFRKIIAYDLNKTWYFESV